MNLLPGTNMLIDSLSDLFMKQEGPLEIISRQDFSGRSTFPVEIIMCKTHSGKTINLFCKYRGGISLNGGNQKGGIDYEARIYSEVLSGISLSNVNYYGLCQFFDSGESSLVIEYLGKHLRLFESGDIDAFLKAAIWIGMFHSISEKKYPDFLKIYDTSFYRSWSSRFEHIMLSYQEEHPWLKGLVKYFENNIEILTAAPQTIVHGEYYPENILIKGGLIYPVDWESSAIGPGEIDLASLIENLNENLTDRVIDAYTSVRWPTGLYSRNEFDNRLLLAQIYFHFRWIVEEDNLEAWLKGSTTFNQLMNLARRADCIKEQKNQ